MSKKNNISKSDSGAMIYSEVTVSQRICYGWIDLKMLVLHVL